MTGFRSQNGEAIAIEGIADLVFAGDIGRAIGNESGDRNQGQQDDRASGRTKRRAIGMAGDLEATSAG